MSETFSRRDLLITATAATTALFLTDSAHAESGRVDAPTPSIATARGTVFDDTDGSGRLTAGKRGVAGVLVSNGRDVVRTDTQGRYAIPLPENCTLFVIKPRDRMTAVSDTKLPRFYYHHYPRGSPQWRPDPKTAPKEAFDAEWYHPGIPASGALPDTIDFPLVRRPEPDRFRVVLFGDPQPGNDEQLDWMARTVVQELIGVEDVAFGITVGDVVNVGRLQYFDPVNRLMAHVGVPWYNAVGNHDQNLIVPDDSQSCATFESVYGPTTYAFEHGPVTFIVLKNLIRAPFKGFETPSDSNGGYRPIGDDYTEGLQPDQLAFLTNFLATVPKDRPVVLLSHAPLVNEKKKGDTADVGTGYERQIFALLSGRPHTLSVSGHTHVQAHYFLGKKDGFTGPGEHHHFNSICVRGAGYRGPLDETQTPSCTASDGCEHGYSFITFDKTSYDITYKSARRPTDHQMNIFSPDSVAVGYGATPVRVNVFAGSSRSKVELRVAGRPALPMSQTFTPDPFMVETLRLQTTDAPWLGPKYKEKKPKKSRHVWQADLPAGLPVGTHVIEVRTTDMFGKMYVARRPFRVIEKAASMATTRPAEHVAAAEGD